jgi:hypothetical protein
MKPRATASSGYDHDSIQSAIHFIDEGAPGFPAAIRRIQTDHGSEWGTGFTWHLYDLGIAHTHIRPVARSPMGKSGAVIAPTRMSFTDA